MPYKATALTTKHRGWFYDQVNARLAAVFNGTEVFDFDANDMIITPATTVTGLLTASAAMTATTGNITATAGDVRVTAGNVRLGTVSAFGTTEPTAWVVCRSATQPAGAITTASGIGSNDTVVRKIIADGTVSNVG